MVSCIQCRGRGFCHRDFCPIYTKAESMFRTIDNIKDKEFLGASPPTIFIGSKLDYPKVNVGILSPSKVEDTKDYDNPNYWAENNYTVQKIVELRSSLINSRFKANVFDVRNSKKILEIAQEVAMASKSANLEIGLDKKPKIKLNFNTIGLPMGPSANLKKCRATENIKVFKPVEKVFYDYDMKSSDGIKFLYEKGFNENQLFQFLSAGLIGIKKNRKLVPTRWSIVANLDTLGKQLINQVRDFNAIDNYKLYIGNYLGNYYYIMLLPDIFYYELYEGYLPGALWNFSGKIEFATDFESSFGRKKYATETVGGYYAARFPILEKLIKMKRQASVLAIRFETPEYSAPLGVWVVTAAARKTLENNPIEFSNLNEMLNYARNAIKIKFRYDINNNIKDSKLLKNIKTQTRLTKWF